MLVPCELEDVLQEVLSDRKYDVWYSEHRSIVCTGSNDKEVGGGRGRKKRGRKRRSERCRKRRERSNKNRVSKKRGSWRERGSVEE